MNEACPTGKRGYDSPQYADIVRRRTVLTNIKEGRTHQFALNKYQCQRCKKWHVGHTRVDDSETLQHNGQ